MLTPEQARDLVAWAGSIRAAARAIGVTHPTVIYWLHPERAERKRQYYRDYYDALTGVQFNQLLLNRRRTKALRRQRERTTIEGVQDG